MDDRRRDGTWMASGRTCEPHLLASNSNPYGHTRRTLSCRIDVDCMDTPRQLPDCMIGAVAMREKHDWEDMMDATIASAEVRVGLGRRSHVAAAAGHWQWDKNGHSARR